MEGGMISPEFLAKFSYSISSLREDNLNKFMEYYAEDATFNDPLHTLKGKDKIDSMYKAMYNSLEDARFGNLETVKMENTIVVRWLFTFTVKRIKTENQFSGVSWIELNEENLIKSHTDFWDASELISLVTPMKYPINWIKKQISKLPKKTIKYEAN